MIVPLLFHGMLFPRFVPRFFSLCILLAMTIIKFDLKILYNLIRILAKPETIKDFINLQIVRLQKVFISTLMI